MGVNIPTTPNNPSGVNMPPDQNPLPTGFDLSSLLGLTQQQAAQVTAPFSNDSISANSNSQAQVVKNQGGGLDGVPTDTLDSANPPLPPPDNSAIPQENVGAVKGNANLAGSLLVAQLKTMFLEVDLANAQIQVSTRGSLQSLQEDWDETQRKMHDILEKGKMEEMKYIALAIASGASIGVNLMGARAVGKAGSEGERMMTQMKYQALDKVVSEQGIAGSAVNAYTVGQESKLDADQTAAEFQVNMVRDMKAKWDKEMQSALDTINQIINQYNSQVDKYTSISLGIHSA